MASLTLPQPLSALERLRLGASAPVETAAARDANNREAALALGLLAAENDDPSLALEAFDWLPLRADASRNEVLVKAVSWRADQDLAGASALYKLALDAQPDDPLAAWNLATLQAEYAGDFQAAMDTLAPWSDQAEVAERRSDLKDMERAAARGKLDPVVQSKRESKRTLDALSATLDDYERLLTAARCPVNDDDLVAAELVLEQSRALLASGHADRSLEAARRLVWFSIRVDALIPRCEGSAAPPPLITPR